MIKNLPAKLILFAITAMTPFALQASDVEDEGNNIASISYNGSSVSFQSNNGAPLSVIVSGTTGYNITLGSETGEVTAPIGEDPLPDGKYRYEIRSEGQRLSDSFVVTNGFVQ